MKHFGDITKIDGNKVPLVDIVTGGSPCQDLSVAGKRAGLEGARSGLFMEQIRVIKEMRNESVRQLQMRGATFDIRCIQPRYMVWENVCGAFTSNNGEDFRAVLEETAKIADQNAIIPRPSNGKWTPAGCIMGDGWSIAWRVHDAQFWGVPQRRKRIALVADFGGQSAPEILFERQGVSGDLEQSKAQGKETSGNTRENTDQTVGINGEVAGTLDASYYKGCGERAGVEREVVLDDTKVYGFSAYNSNCMKSSNPNSGIYEADTSRTLDNNGGNPSCNQGGMIVLEDNGSRDSHKGDGYKESDVMYTLNTVEQHAVCSYQDKTGSLMASGYDKLGTQEALNDMYVVQGCAYDGGQISPTLTAHNANGAQRMPDKDNFNAVITYNEVGGGTEPTTASHGGFFLNARSDGKADALLATDYKDPQLVCYGLDRASFNQGKNAQYDFSVQKEIAQPLVARGPGGVLTTQ